jgi:hypothetical protein
MLFSFVQDFRVARTCDQSRRNRAGRTGFSKNRERPVAIFVPDAAKQTPDQS